MTGHVPFDAKSDWTNPYCGNSSNDPLVDKMIGNAYHVVRTVYCNLGNLKLIYDFLNQYGMVLGVQSEDELKSMTTSAAYVRLYDKTRAGDRQVTDYLYVEGDRTGILPTDPKATGSWIKIATSGDNGGGESNNDGAYLPWVFSNGSAAGGETTIRVPDGTVGVPFIIVNGYMNYVGKGFTYNVSTLTITLAQPLEQGDEVVCLLTGVPAVPNNPNVSNWIQINWLYNNGAAVGGEQIISVPYTFQDITAVYKNGLRLYKGLADKSYSLDAANQRFILTEPLVTDDRIIAQIGGEATVLNTPDRTIEEVARSANLKDSEVILSTDVAQTLNGKKVVFSVSEQKSYGLPSLPTNVYIQAVANGKLTYNPGSVTVDLLPLANSTEKLRLDLAENTGANSIGSATGDTVEERLVSLDSRVVTLIEDTKTVLSLAELRLITPRYAGQRVRTLSAASISIAEIPFGGGEFYARAKGSMVDDGGYIIVPADGELVWVRVMTGKVMLDDFGAKADWSTDNSVAIRKALTFGVANKTIIHANSGTYLTSETVEIRKGTGLVGVSRNSTTIAKTTNTPLVVIGSGTTPNASIDAFVALLGDIYNMEDLTGASDMSFLQLSGLTLRREGLIGPSNAVRYGIWAPKVNTSMFKDLRVECGYFGFWGQDIWSNMFDSVQFLGLGVGQYAGMQIDKTVGSVHALSGTSNVLNCVGVANYQIGFHINSNQYTTLNSCTADGIRPISGGSETFACPFYFINPHGITMNSCGSEGVAGERLRIITDEYAVYDSTVTINAYQGQIVPENPLIALPVFRIQGGGTKKLRVVMNACNFAKDITHTNQQAGFITGANVAVALVKCVYDTPLITSGGAVVTEI